MITLFMHAVNKQDDDRIRTIKQILILLFMLDDSVSNAVGGESIKETAPSVRIANLLNKDTSPGGDNLD